MIAQSFNTLYNLASKIGKLALLDIINNFSYIEPAEALVYLGKQNREELCDTIAQRVVDLLKEFDEGERSIAASLLYSGLACCYAKVGEFGEAERYVDEALGTVKNISIGYYEKLKPYLEMWFMRPDTTGEEELDLLRRYIYYKLLCAYLVMGRNEEVEKLASETCRIEKELGIQSELLGLYC